MKTIGIKSTSGLNLCLLSQPAVYTEHVFCIPLFFPCIHAKPTALSVALASFVHHVITMPS